MADISILTDNFNDNSINGTLWGTYTASSGTVAETSQHIVISPAASTVGSEAQLYSQSSYSLTGSNCYLNFVQGSSQSVDTYVKLLLDANNTVAFIWNNGTLYSYTLIAAVEAYRNSASVTAGASTWLRIRESGGTLYWDYSTNDRSSWTNLDSMANPFAVTSLALLLGSYEWGSSASPGSTIFDNINTTPATGYTVSVSDSVSVFATVNSDGGYRKTLVWSGIGMNLFTTVDNIAEPPTSVFDGDCDALIMNGFTTIRVPIETYTYPDPIAFTKAAALRAMARGLNVVWGIGAGGTTLTSTSWTAFSSAVQSAAQWAQDNGIYEFQLANEEEYHIDGTTLTTSQLISNMKSLATTCQSIYTRGNITYATSPDYYDNWIAAGKGDIDMIAGNQYLTWDVYGTYDPDVDDPWYIQKLNDMITAFGTGGFYLSEWGVSSSATANFSPDEAVQAAKVSDLISYISNSGVTRAYFYEYYDDTRPSGRVGFGIKKTTGTYYQMWNSVTSLVQSDSTVSKSDAVAISESVTMQISTQGTPSINHGDDVSISESVTLVTSTLQASSPFYRRPKGSVSFRI